MAIGKLKTLVHLSQQRHLPNARLVPGHNDKGYGFIEDAEGREVYFAHDVVQHRFGFDDLRQGQLLEYTLENGPFLRATSVRAAAPGEAAFELTTAHSGSGNHMSGS
jgi:cold shock CspA family protein